MPPRQRNQQTQENFHVPNDMQKVADDQPALPAILKSAHDFMDSTWTQQDELAPQQA
ncbi:hypothetical protein F4813DRAFT_390980 [Daldinia decipiens]|uniref:uncharacterized protein n=1 Tax=Daldinia decipiens TaxID=326647 RepID=UPI0020C39550|nr:uncharacterized protein F4813DRAFT_390980 [Daldinia decipiens]KAI1656300.1 hypothetical protein F4813DRAFT_390980 [Daldinia decipiens]